MPTRIQYDAALPTIVKYVGLALTVILTLIIMIAVLLGNASAAIQLTPVYVPLGGMLLYKTVKNAAEDGEQ